MKCFLEIRVDHYECCGGYSHQLAGQVIKKIDVNHCSCPVATPRTSGPSTIHHGYNPYLTLPAIQQNNLNFHSIFLSTFSCSGPARHQSIKLPVFGPFQNKKVIIVHENLKMIHFIHDTISELDQ